MKGKVRNAVIICAGVLILTVMLTVVLYYYEDKAKRDNAWIYSATEESTSFESNYTKKADINKADFDTLSQVKGIGRQVAYDILNYRDNVGRISSMYELKTIHSVDNEVYGILCDCFTVTGSNNYYGNNESYSVTKINLNTAQTNQLMTVDGVTQEIAENIIVYRNSHGKYKTVADLLDVEGMTITLYNSISDQFTV